MSTPPADGSWTVAIHAGRRSETPIGTGIVIDQNLVLTCAHVACPDGAAGADLWVSFPLAGVGYWDRRAIGRCVRNGLPDDKIDLALLELIEPVPAAVTPARLRCLPPKALLDQEWWALGFPQSATSGSTAHGRVSGWLGWGKVHLANESGSGLAKGFSGAALWSPEYQAVVGIVEQHHANGNGHALTFQYPDEQLPEMGLSALAAWRLSDADDAALAAWGWSLSGDEERDRHWLPRARGVAVRSERGYRFRGRTTALTELKAWLDRPDPAGRPLVLTGSPGVGKSAVLGRVVTTADPVIAALLPGQDTAVRATVGSVSCAVHAKGKSALDVAVEIARAAGVRLPKAAADELPAAMRDGLHSRPGCFNLIVDALDEAATPEQARRLVRDVLLPLARGGAHAGIQVAVGTRRHDDAGDLLACFGTDHDLIDLDEPAYFAEEDLVQYAMATLMMIGDERVGNPYATPEVAVPVARRIAELARGNFLVAGLLARGRALRDDSAADPAQVQFAGGVGAAVDTYLNTLPAAGVAPARLVLTALAYAETPGLPVPLWRAAIEAFGVVVTEAELIAFCRTRAADFLVTGAGRDEISYRLFHQALNDELRAARGDRAGTDEARLVSAWAAVGSASGWSSAPGYLLSHLAEHAARTGQLDALLSDDGFLLHADLDRVLRVAASAGPSAQARVQLLTRATDAIGAAPSERAALFSVADRLDRLQTGIRADGAPYYARWAHTLPRQERTVLEGHTQAVYDVCPITVDGRALLASAGEDGMVRLWDPRTNQSEYDWRCHDDCVRSLCAVRVGHEQLLATASHDGTIRLWDPLSNMLVRELRQHQEWVRNICTIPLPDGDVLASAGDDGTTRVWDPATGTLLHTLDGHAGWVTAVTHLPLHGLSLLASTGYDGTVRVWDPLTGAPLLKLSGHEGWVTTLHAVPTADGTLIASAGYDGTVRLWDARDGVQVRAFTTSGPLTDLCTVDTAMGTLLVATGEDGIIRLWNTADWTERAPLVGHFSWIRAVCELPLDDRQVLATAGDDGTVRLWDPDSPRPGPITDGRQLRAVTALATVPMEGTELVASAGGDDSVRLWDPASGELRTEYRAEAGAINDISVVVDHGSVQVVAANSDSTIALWDLTGAPADDMTEHFESVNAVCAFPAVDGWLIASAGEDLTIRLWTPHDRIVRTRLTGHSEWVTALTVVPRYGRTALASGDKTGSVRLWDADGTPLWDVGHSDAINDLCAVITPDGPLLASACADGEIKLWEASTGRPRGTLSGHSRAVTALCTMPWGAREIIVSASQDRTVRLWNPSTARVLRTIPVHHPALSCHLIANTLLIGLDQGLLALAVENLLTYAGPSAS